MRINADFSQAAMVDRSVAKWISSPESGVDRIMLDRIGDEVARATSIVRYAAGSSFSRHEHAKGEEFLVLEGIFSDDQGDYPTGVYVRNPPGSSHSPHSKDGCRILVKLRQFDPQDLTRVVVDTRDAGLWQAGGSGDSLPLHNFGSEQVFMLRIAAKRNHSIAGNPGGTEIFLVSGSVRYRDTDLPAESWLRLPANQSADIKARSDSVLWVKCGHLPPANIAEN
jgi:anti-sigma factor ChrR (cupin superfamily)